MRTLAAFLILAAWLAITVLTGAPVEETSTIAAVVTESFARQLALAAGFLALMALLLRWPDLGFGPARPGSLRVLWLPALYVAVFLVLGFLAGPPPPAILLLLLVNAFLGSFSEEVMFRGFLYAGLRDALPIWPAILLTSVLFGAPHVLNYFLIGHLGAAIGQAIFATFSGIMFLSLRIRTGSLWPVIVLHMLWNTGLVLMGREAAPLSPDQAIPVTAVVVVLLAMLPILAYPFWLLRRVGRDGDGIGRRARAAAA
jgi:hypothetical protein